jgi:hypothetical protein
LKTDSKKILLGYASYGISFNLKNPKKTRIGDPITGTGKPGKILKDTYNYAFYEVTI